MTAEVTTDSIFLDGQAVPISMDRIEGALRQLWAEQRRRDRPVARACVLNLVVVARDMAGATFASEVIQRLTASYPCRAIVLISEETEELGQLQAWLSAHCQLPRASGQRVCCEQVTLRAAGEATEHLPSAVLPLLVPDLPVLLWWMDEPPFGGATFEQLVMVADRLIVDTRQFTDPTFSLSQLAALARASAGRIDICDLNWARLTPWQEQLARLFDSTDTAPFLEGLERLGVRYARQRESAHIDPEQALLFAGWLLSRLGWKLPPALARVGAGHYRGRLRRAGREIAVEIAPVDVEADAADEEISGALTLVEVRARAGERDATFRIERDLEREHRMVASIQLAESEPVESMTRPLQSDIACFLAEHLDVSEHDYLYEAALETAAHLSGGGRLMTA